MRAFVVDAFTAAAFRGNPAGVVLDDGTRDDAWRQALAAELRHSETAFVRSRTEGGYDLRWFTPTDEVDLCGHATLATAHVLATEVGATGPMVFHTRSGELRADASADGITLDFPAATLTPDEGVGPAVAAAIGVDVQEVHRTSNRDLLAVVADEHLVATSQPDLDAVARTGGRGLIVTALATPGAGRDFVSRFFAPNVGVPEDPVTGSAHCALTPFWAQRLGRDTLVADQVSPRGGRLAVELRGDRVLLRGSAVTVLSGELRS